LDLSQFHQLHRYPDKKKGSKGGNQSMASSKQLEKKRGGRSLPCLQVRRETLTSCKETSMRREDQLGMEEQKRMEEELIRRREASI
jgi:hypothetical protein